MYAFDKATISLLILVMVLALITIAIEPARGDPLVQVQAPVFRSKKIGNSYLNFTFQLNGSIRIVNSFGDVLNIGRARSVTTGTITVSLWSNSTAVAYHVLAVFRSVTVADVWIYFDFARATNAVKITIAGTLAVAGSFSFPLAFPKGQFTQDKTIWSGADYTRSAVGFSWADAPAGSWNPTTGLISWTVGQAFIIDPSVIINSNDLFANIWGGIQPKLWTGQGRIWAFYSANVSAANTTLYAAVRYNTSLCYGSGNPTWSTPYYFRVVNRADDFAVYFNSTHFSFAYTNISLPLTGPGSTVFGIVYWKLFQYFSNGTIKDKSTTWKTVVTYAANYTADFPNTVISSDGTIYVTVTKRWPITVYRNLFVYRNAWKNGSWSEDSNFQIGASIANYAACQPGHLTNGNLALSYNNSTSALWYLFYNGTSKARSGYKRLDMALWGYVDAGLYPAARSMVTFNDEIYVTFAGRKSGVPVNWSVCFNFQTASRAFNATPERVQLIGTVVPFPVLTHDPVASPNKVYVFWRNTTASYTSYVSYKPRDTNINWLTVQDSSLWNWNWASTLWFDMVDPPATSRLSAIRSRYDNKFMLQYMNKSSSPYQVCFNYFNATLKSWTLISTWTLSLQTRLWTAVSTWTFSLISRSWKLVSTWTFYIITRSWVLISTWTFYFIQGGATIWFLLLVFIVLISLGALFVVKEVRK